MSKTWLLLLVLLSTAFSAGAQTGSHLIQVDAYLSVVFPGTVNQFDTAGNTLFQSSVDNTTYQVVRRAAIFDEANERRREELTDEAANDWMGNPKFDGLARQVTDTVIGGARGRFVQMKRVGSGSPYVLFIFLTIRGRNIYSLACVSFKPETSALGDARQFYGGVTFHQLKLVPAK